MVLRTIKLGFVNVYAIIEHQSCILVDTGTKGKEKKILSALSEYGIEAQDIKLIVLTHGHADHFGSVDAIAKASGAKVLVHKLEYNLMRTGREDGIQGVTLLGKLVRGTLSKMIQSDQGPRLDYHGDLLITEPFGLEDYGVEGQVLPTPGHSLGSLSVLLSDGSAIVGDSLMAMMPWEKPGKPMLAYDLEMIKRSMDQLILIGAKRFYLSHGKDYDVKDITIALEKFTR